MIGPIATVAVYRVTALSLFVGYLSGGSPGLPFSLSLLLHSNVYYQSFVCAMCLLLFLCMQMKYADERGAIVVG
jgi:hypothetical protein